MTSEAAVPTPTVTRRRFVQGGCAAVAAATLQRALAPAAVFANHVDHTLVTIFLRGAMDGLSAAVPYDDARYHDLRPSIRVPEAASFPLGDGFGLHPSLAPLYPLRDKLAVVHSAGQDSGSRSHFDAQERVDSGIPEQLGAASGWLARHVAAVGGTAAPLSVVTWGLSPTPSLRSLDEAAALTSIETFALSAPAGLQAAGMQTLRNLYGSDDLLGRRARATLDAIEAVGGLRSGYDPSTTPAYPDTQLGRGLREVAHTIRSDVGLAAATLDVGGWDTHDGQGDASAGELTWQLDDLGRSLAAFADDLSDRLDRVTVVTLSEFGRRVAENGSGGTDHGTGTTMFVLGDGVVGGVHGDWLGLEDDATPRGDVPVTTDFRSVLSEILVDRLGGTDLATVFPDFTPAMRGIA